MTQNKLLNEYLDIIKKPLPDKGFYYDVDTAEECVKVADEFAIEFAEWLVIRYNEDIIYDEYTKKELLEIYKKEKEL